MPPTPTLRQILAGIADRLERIPGLHVTDFAPGQINPPAAIVGVPPIGTYLTSLGGRRPVLEPTVTVLVSSVVDRAGQLTLADFASPEGERSIPAAFASEQARTLGGLVGSCLVVSFEPFGLQDVGVIGYFGGVFTCQVVF